MPEYIPRHKLLAKKHGVPLTQYYGEPGTQIGLMGPKKPEEYGSHEKLFEIKANGIRFSVIDVNSEKSSLSTNVGGWRYLGECAR